MSNNRMIGLVLVVIGILLNNYAYLNDLFSGKHEGMIYVGMQGSIAIVVGVVIILAGVIVLMRKPADSAE